MEISELQELVLDNLSSEEIAQEGEQRSAFQILTEGNSRNVSLDLFLEDSEKTIAEIETLSADEVLYQVASLLARSKVLGMNYYSFANSYIQTLFRAINYKQFANREDLLHIKEHLAKIRQDHIEEEQKKRAREATGTKERILDILEDVWGEDLQDNLTDITGVTKATAKKWIAGANIGGGNFRSLQTVAKVFHVLQKEKGYKRDDLLAWYDRPLPGAKAPRELFVATSWWGCPEDVRDFLKREGIENF